MFTAQVNDKLYEVEFLDDNLQTGIINGKKFKLDMVNNENSYHVISEHKSYNINILSIDHTEKKVSLTINNAIHQISVSNELDKLIKSMGIKHQVTVKNQNWALPCPVIAGHRKNLYPSSVCA